MLVYPEYPIPEVPVEFSIAYDIVKSDISFNFSYRRRRSFRNKKQFKLKYSWLTLDEVSVLQNFYRKVQESDDGVFVYISHSYYNVDNEFVAKVENVNIKEYELPLSDWTELSIYVNGNEIFDYDIIYSYPRRKLVISSKYSLNTGDLITCSFKRGKLAVVCEFDSNSLGIQHLVAGYSNISDLVLTEVLNY
jgi:hypothetical protein